MAAKTRRRLCLVLLAVFLLSLTVASKGFAVTSDDFSDPVLNTGLWWFVDPLGDGEVAINGTQALISVPAGVSHDLWTSGNFAPRLMQATEDTDFEIEVKFESVPTFAYQLQGLLAEQDSDNFIRADFYSDSSSVHIFAAAFSNGSPSVKVNESIDVSGSELYLRLGRQGNTWTLSYSEDGLNWVQAISFYRWLTIQSVGVFSGNAGAAPAHTAVVDYFFNTATPIEPEDGEALYSVTVNATGSGSVTKSPDQLQYQPGELVELTAVPSAGWAFTGWTGDATGVDNPITVTVNSNLIIGTDFALTGPQQYALSVLKSGEGFGTVTSAPAGVDCGVDCSEDFDEGTNVVLTVLSDAGSEFAGWTGSVDCSDGVVTMDGPHSCTATFNLPPLPQHTLSISTLGAGQVTLNPTGGVYDQGTSVQMSAIPDDGWLFEGWSGDLVANQNPATLVMDQDYSVVGNFAPDSIPPVISNIQVAAGQTTATVTWTTDEPATGIVDYGETVAYELGSVQDSVLATGHVVTLTGLEPGVDYHLQVTATDESLNTAVSPDVLFSTTTDPSGIVSDDFNTGQLDTGLWWFVDPLSDGQVTLDGTRALVSVPSGVSHDMWGPGFESPRLMQATEDTDFDIEVKFESVPSTKYQMQGLVVEQDSGNLIRADFYSDGSSVHIFAAAFSNGSASVKLNSPINVSASDLYLRLTRDGNTWTLSYSEDGLSWVQATSFSHSLAVQSVGVFAGNYSSQGSAPAYTAIVDYFFNTATPIEPEDGNTLYAVTVGVTGSGSVTKNPDQLQYHLGEVVELTAVPSSGWTFTGWSGDATGSENPLNVVVNADLSVSATFTSPSQVSLDVTTIGSGQVSLDPPGGVYSEGTVVELTAVRDPDWQFAAWSGDLTGTQNPATIVMMRDHAVVGTFTYSPGPVIDVWYGSEQTFGSIGIPQPWVNILGKVSATTGVSQLTFSLNGGPEQNLSMGPYRRLEEPGDFNIEIAFVDLFDGVNQVDIYARDGLDNLSIQTVMVNFFAGNVWPLDSSIDWSSVARPEEGSQIVDGLWQLSADRLRPSAYGYDRTVAIGDWSWTDYEVLVPITLHDFSPEGFTGFNNAPAFGIALRWPGHTNWTGDQQPSWGWYPGGATAWYTFRSSGGGNFRITDFDELTVLYPPAPSLIFGVTYLMRMRVETLGEGISRYSVKVWGANEEEPQDWGLVAIDTSDVPNGSLLLIAHYVDVSFGNIVIQPIPE